MRSEAKILVVAVGSRVTDTAALRPGQEPARVRAVKGGRYVLAGDESGPGPDELAVSREGADLHVRTADGVPVVIIEGYHDTPGPLLSAGADGAVYPYTPPTDGEEAGSLEEGAGTSLQRGTLPVAGEALPHGPAEDGAFWPWLAGAGMLGAAGAAWGLSRRGGGDDNENVGGGEGGSDGDEGGSDGGGGDKPGAPVIEGVYDDAGERTGLTYSGGVTDDTTPELRGAGQRPGDTITVRDGERVLGTVKVSADGSWHFAPELGAGEYEFTVTVTGPSGTESSRSAPWKLTVDLEAPGRAEITGTAGDAPLPPGGATNDATPTFIGRGEPGGTVIIYDRGVEIGRVGIGADGSWQFTPQQPLEEGEHTFTARAVDSAGNAGLESEPYSFEVDLTPPVAPEPDEVGDGGATDDPHPSFTGSGEPGSRVFIEYARAGDAESVVVEVEVNSEGRWRWSPDAALADGSWTFRSWSEDAAGNRGESSETWSIEVDTTPPAAARSFSVEDGGVTVEFNGSGLSPGARIQIRCGDNWYERELSAEDIAAGRVNIPVPGATMMNVSVGVLDGAGNASEHLSYGPVSREDFTRFPSMYQITPETDLNGFRLKEGTVFVDHRIENWKDNFLRINETKNFELNDDRAATGIEFDYSGLKNSELKITLTFYTRTGEDYSVDFVFEPEENDWYKFRFELPDGMDFTDFTIQVEPLDGIGYLKLDNVGFSGGDFGGSFDQVPPPDRPAGGGEDFVGNPDDNVFSADGLTLLSGLQKGIEGGDGVDTLRLKGGGLEVDLRALGVEMSGIEIVDLTGNGDNMLRLSLEDVLSNGGADLFYDSGAGTSQMMIKGDEGDSVELRGLAGENGWSGIGSVTVGGTIYNVYQYGSLDAEVLIQQGVSADLI